MKTFILLSTLLAASNAPVIIGQERTPAAAGEASPVRESAADLHAQALQVERSAGSSSDLGEAMALYRQAAAVGDAAAQYRLARAYDDGDGVAVNALEAVKWYRRAAEQGHPMAQVKLGMCHFRGRGVHQDRIEACKWMMLAAESKARVQARANLKMMSVTITPSQMAEAQSRVRSWKAARIGEAVSSRLGAVSSR